MENKEYEVSFVPFRAQIKNMAEEVIYEVIGDHTYDPTKVQEWVEKINNRKY